MEQTHNSKSNNDANKNVCVVLNHIQTRFHICLLMIYYLSHFAMEDTKELVRNLPFVPISQITWRSSQDLNPGALLQSPPYYIASLRLCALVWGKNEVLRIAPPSTPSTRLNNK